MLRQERICSCSSRENGWDRLLRNSSISSCCSSSSGKVALRSGKLGPLAVAGSREDRGRGSHVPDSSLLRFRAGALLGSGGSGGRGG